MLLVLAVTVELAVLAVHNCSASLGLVLHFLLARLLPKTACQRLRLVGSSLLKTVHLTSTAFETIHCKLFADRKSNNVQFQNQSQLFI